MKEGEYRESEKSGQVHSESLEKHAVHALGRKRERKGPADGIMRSSYMRARSVVVHNKAIAR